MNWCFPFYKLQKIKIKLYGSWMKERIKAFWHVKYYLRSLLTLSFSRVEDETILCLEASKTTISTPLMKDQSQTYMPMYYDNQFNNSKTRYFPIEKLVFPLIIILRKLRLYCSAYDTIVLSDYSFRIVVGVELTGFRFILLHWSRADFFFTQKDVRIGGPGTPLWSLSYKSLRITLTIFCEREWTCVTCLCFLRGLYRVDDTIIIAMIMQSSLSCNDDCP